MTSQEFVLGICPEARIQFSGDEYWDGMEVFDEASRDVIGWGKKPTSYYNGEDLAWDDAATRLVGATG